jgi:hypothetical protein
MIDAGEYGMVLLERAAFLNWQFDEFLVFGGAQRKDEFRTSFVYQSPSNSYRGTTTVVLLLKSV